MAEDVVSAWMRSAGRIPLLTPAEELHLARRVQRWLNHPEPVPSNIIRSGQRARERMIQANLRLVVTIAQKFRRRLRGTGLEVEDLLQEGVIGLARGVEKFDPEKGYKFSTYAYWWCQQAMGRVTDVAGYLRTPSSAVQILRRWQFRPEGQTLAEFCREFDYDPAKVRREIEHAARAQVTSLDQRCSAESGEGATIGEMLAVAEDRPLEDLDLIEAVEHLRELQSDAVALLELQAVEGAGVMELAALQGVSHQRLRVQLEAAREALRSVMPAHIAAEQERAYAAA